MKCLVMKFGGTSLGNEERIKLVSEKIINSFSYEPKLEINVFNKFIYFFFDILILINFLFAFLIDNRLKCSWI